MRNSAPSPNFSADLKTTLPALGSPRGKSGGSRTAAPLDAKRARAETVNAAIRVMGSHGRRFFWSNKFKRFATMEVDRRGRVWFLDDHTGRRTYTHDERYNWRAFSHGGTMRRLVCRFRRYIMTGALVPAGHFGPWPDWYCGGDLWGYGEAMETVRRDIRALGILTDPDTEQTERN